MKRSEARAILRRVVRRAIERMAASADPRTQAEAAANAYAQLLIDDYDEWADGAAAQIAAEPDHNKRDTLIALLLLALLGTLKNDAHLELPNAITAALGGTPAPAAVYSQLVDLMNSNDNYMATSLIPDVQGEIDKALAAPAVQEAIAAGNTSVAIPLIRSGLDAMSSRVIQYSGTWWALFNYAVGAAADASGQRIRWTRDAAAQHCGTCLKYGEKIYNSFAAMLDETGGISPADGTDCHGNCRCILEVVD